MPIRVLVVDDSFFMRKLISDMIKEDKEIQVLDTAKDGLEAIDKIRKLQPDVVTLDIEMPKLNGLETLKIIMEENPLPVIMLSSLTYAGAEATIESLSCGAFDFIQKPSGSISLDISKVKEDLIDKIKIAYQNKPKISRIKKINKETKQFHEMPITNQKSSNILSLVAIGSSTGGPKALQNLLPLFSKNFPLPILIVQHMPAHFTKSLANRLNNLSEITVVEAEQNQLLLPSYAYIAPGDWHMKIKKDSNNRLFIDLSKEDTVNGVRPAVDILFNSLAELNNITLYLTILTGMGADGTKGLINIKNKIKNVIAFAEAEESCVVFGMPKSAILTGKIDKIVPITEMANAIMQSVYNNGR